VTQRDAALMAEVAAVAELMQDQPARFALPACTVPTEKIASKHVIQCAA
jgi:hypothetical protein